MFTVTSILSRTVRLHGDQIAIQNTERSFTWSETADRISRAAAVLHSNGVRAGDRFGIVSRNNFRLAELIYAGYWMGATAVPVNYRFAPPEIAYVLDNAECKLVIVEDFFLDVFGEEHLKPWADKILLLSMLGKEIPPYDNFETLLSGAQPMDMREVSPDDEALLLYTGGTTGRAKGVPLSHRNIVSNALQLGFELGPRREDVYLHVAPMFHSADLLATPWFISGASHVFLSKFSEEGVLQAIQRYGVSNIIMTPTMLIKTMNAPDFERFDISSLRQIVYGSSPMAQEWIKRMLERFKGVEIVQAYGLTETSPILTLLPMSEHQQAIEADDDTLLGSVGRQLPAVDMKIVDEDGKSFPTGEAGEIIVRGPNVAKGYLKRPEATEESFREGWFYTGDIGRLDDNGYLFLLDRKKDMIITGGEIVYSSEVEAVLHRHPKVHDCAVIGVPDEAYGETLLAAVVPVPGETPDADELIEHCRKEIGGYKIPRRYVFPDQLPKSAIDKVLKTELRKTYGEKE